jgi:hypothetical protein
MQMSETASSAPPTPRSPFTEGTTITAAPLRPPENIADVLRGQVTPHEPTRRPGPPKHVFEHPGMIIAEASPAAQPATGFDYPTVLRGSTPHFTVYYDPGLGAAGATIADGVLASCESEYAVLQSFFGVSPSSFNIIIAAGIGGAYHYGCSATDLYCDAQTSPLDVDHTRMLVVAEEVEVFSALQGAGWDCGASNGEGLSRVLATLLYPAELDGFTSAASWLDTPDRPDFIDSNDPTDRNYVSIGCSVLFLNWLRQELTYGWQAIVAAAAPTLAQTYTNLTGQTDGFARFSTQLAARFPIGTPSGVTGDNPFPLDRHAGFLVQGRFGNHGNFEMVTPRDLGGLAHYWRDNDDPAMPWYGPFTFGPADRDYDCVTMIQSNYGEPGNLELIARSGDQLDFYWRDSGPSFTWNGPYRIAGDVAGNPALIQSRFGARGNFELVVPLRDGGLAHYWRNNDDPSMPWNGPYPFGSQAGNVEGVALLESNYGDPGNLEVVARAGSQLLFFWRDSGPAFAWNGPYVITGNAQGRPAMVQGRFGARGNFELVVPTVGGGLAHYWRNNDDPAMPWYGPYPFGAGRSYSEVSLAQSNFGDPGNLEVVAESGDGVDFFWRDSGPSFTWNGPSTIESGV